jgi:hypothetical protein
MDSEVSNHGVYTGIGIKYNDRPAVSEIITLTRSGFGKFPFSLNRVDQKQYINLINFIHFSGSYLLAHVSFVATNEEFLLKVYPEPCQKDIVTCRVLAGSKVDLRNFNLKNIIINDGKKLLFVPIRPVSVTETSFTCIVKKKGFIFSERSRKRILCYFIDAEIQFGNMGIMQGVLEDFNLGGLRISLNTEDTGIPSYLKGYQEVAIQLKKDNHCIFSGKCKIIRSLDAERSIIVKPLSIPHTRFKGRKNRNPRVNLIPTPKIIFNHPFNNKKMTCEVCDITTSGFSIIEDSDNALLMPGMIIPSLAILYPGGLKINCSAQVIYTVLKRFRNQVRHGLSILDMKMRDYSTLFDIIGNAVDPHANMSSEISMDDLWEFFFDSGFIYSGKYEHLSLIKEKFKNTYQKLYHEGQDVFTNFTYQKNGRIVGHNCTIKAYQRSWMIHHLAARSTGARRIGLDVLKHSHYFFDGMYRLPSVGMDYMIMYFRPNNRFPCFFFGGFCRDTRNPKACSMDLFAYKNIEFGSTSGSLPEEWTVCECEHNDIDELRTWYGEHSRGLAIDAFCLDTKTDPHEENITETYGRIGLKRNCSFFVLKKNAKACAYFLVDESDAGINLSELLNSIKIFVTDPTIPWEVVMNTIDSFKERYDTHTIPVLVYPSKYVEDLGISYDKKYYLWVLNTQHGDEYVEYIKQKLHFQVVKFITKMIRSKLGR